VFDRRTAIALGAIVLLAVVLRIGYAVARDDSQGYGVQVVTNADIAHHLRSGDGYHSAVSPELSRAADIASPPLEWDAVWSYPSGGRDRPSAYYLPGYPYIVAAVWYVTGESYIATQVLQAFLDGVIGCIAIFLLLASFCKIRAGVIAALGYALAPPLFIQSVFVLPDSLAAASGLLVLACIAVGFTKQRPVAGAIAAGLAVGLGGWLRGDTLVLAPFVVIALVLTGLRITPGALRSSLKLAWRGVGVKASAALIAAAAVPMLLLGVFYLHVYEEFHLTRPGSGILLWEAIGQQDNPWGIKAPEGYNLDAAALALVQARGLTYGTWEADAFLRDEALDHMKERPGWFVVPTLKRAWRIAALQKPPEAPSNLPSVVLTLTRFVGPLLVPLGLLGLYLLKDVPLLRGLLAATWLARLLPFSFLRDELRFEILIVAVYVALLAVVLDVALARLQLRRARIANVSGAY
jgi:4-amino-4-deoxy-L-arabinose transferase-like glycosyltransferase